MHLAIAATVFPVIFIGELPDKTMFASLVLATRGRPRLVWLGAAAAFLVHVVIATTIGVGVFALLPQRAVHAVVAVMFLVGAGYALRMSNEDHRTLIARETSSHGRVVSTAFLVIFLAEWGDLTQILTANLAARYHSPLSVGVGSALALWAVAGLAVTSGQGLLRVVSVGAIRRITAVVLIALALWSAWSAVG
jgi:Ca2+/H+ antiporter, TMEM165/GDT1 family